MDYSVLKSGSDVRGVAIGDDAVLTAEVAHTPWPGVCCLSGETEKCTGKPNYGRAG